MTLNQLLWMYSWSSWRWAHGCPKHVQEYNQRNKIIEHKLESKVNFHTRFLLQNLTASQLAKKFPAFYATHTFIFVFTATRYLYLTSVTWNHSATFHHIYLILILIFNSHQCPDLPTGVFPWGFPIRKTGGVSFSPRHAKFSAQLIFLDLSIRIIFLDFKLSPSSECCSLSCGWFPGVWILYGNVSKHSVPYS